MVEIEHKGPASSHHSCTQLSSEVEQVNAISAAAHMPTPKPHFT